MATKIAPDTSEGLASPATSGEPNTNDEVVNSIPAPPTNDDDSSGDIDSDVEDSRRTRKELEAVYAAQETKQAKKEKVQEEEQRVKEEVSCDTDSLVAKRLFPFFS